MNLLANLNPGDRRILLVAGILVVLLVVASAILESPEQAGSEVPSSYSADSGGAKAGYLLLQQLGYDVIRWDREPTDLPQSGEGYVLILVDPFAAEGHAEEKAAIQRFLASGGRVLATGYFTGELIPESEVEYAGLPSIGWSTCNPADVSPLTRGGSINMASTARWKMTNPQHVAEYYCEKNAVVVRYPVGRGEVIWWADATPLTNAALREQGDLQLFLGSVGQPSNTTHVLWDEYFHGERKGLEAYAFDTPVMRLIWAQLGMLALAALFTFSRRSDPIQASAEPPRLSAMEFVETLGGVYDRAAAANVAVQIAFDRFRFLLSHRLGLPLESPVVELAHAARARMGYKNDSLESDLREAEQTVYDYELRPEKALQLTQALHDHLRTLKLIFIERARQDRSPGD